LTVVLKRICSVVSVNRGFRRNYQSLLSAFAAMVFSYLSLVAASIRRLASLSHLAVMALYCSAAWFLVELEPTTIFRTELVCAQYDLFLQTFGLLTCVLAIIVHWKDELRSDKRDILRLRLGNAGLVMSLFAAYWCFWSCFCVVPFMATALVQQALVGWQYVSVHTLLLYGVSAACIGFTPLWLVFGLVMFSWRRNESLTLFVLLLILIVAAFVNRATEGMVLNGLWIAQPSTIQAVIWMVSLVVVAGILGWFQRRLDVLSLDDVLSGGVLPRLLRALGQPLAALHARLLNMSHAVVIAFFSALGLAVILSLLRQQASFVVMANIYLGAFVPLLFALRTDSILSIDSSAELYDTIRLRTRVYWQTILSRWCVLSIPMILTVWLFGMVLWVLTPHYTLRYALYCTVLALAWQSLALLFALLLRRGGAWQIVFSLAVYLQLRDDVQHIIGQTIFQKVNLVVPLLNVTVTPVSSDYVTVFCVFVAMLSAAVWLLYKRQKGKCSKIKKLSPHSKLL
jgi:hypothetical protein